MKLKNVLLEIEGPIAVVTVNRPDKLNALNKETINELHEVFQNLDVDNDIRVIILTGGGQKAFVAGADIAEFADYTARKGKQLSKEGQDKLFDFIESQNFTSI